MPAILLLFIMLLLSCSETCGTGLKEAACLEAADCDCGLDCISGACLDPDFVVLGPYPGETSTDSNGIDWITIPEGYFSMGCSRADGRCEKDEHPAHRVNISPFEICVTEITQLQYELLMRENPAFNWECAGCPVEQVSWKDAVNFCEAAGGRLPSEAEWEYAARGGTTSPFACGEGIECIFDAAWISESAQSQSRPVGELPPNPFGLHDMHGNLWEWVADCYHEDYKGNPPADGSAWQDDDCSLDRVIRGGAFFYPQEDARSSNREDQFPNNGTMDIGFRCVRDSGS